MTFEYPGFLWASFAVAIPIIIHLFNFRRPRKVLFSDISLVKEVQRNVVRRIRLKQWLLLAARCLALLALVFLFAHPLRKAPQSSAVKGGKKSIALIIDNSYSMRAGNESGEYWQQARRLAGEIIKGYSRNDEFLVMTTSDLRLHYHFSDQEAAQADLSDLQIRQNTTSLPELLSLSKEIFSKSGENSRVLYFLSDFQNSTLLADSGLSKLGDSTVAINLIPLATRKQKNVFVAETQLLSRILEKHKPLQFSATLVNESGEEIKNLGVRVQFDGKPIPVAAADLAAGERRPIEFNLTPDTSGWLSGWIELEGDPVEFDNKRYFSFYVPEREKMLYVEEQSMPELKLMVSSEVMPQLQVTTVNYRNFSTVNLDEYQSIVLAGITEISGGLRERLTAHLNAGRSLLLIPGEGMKTEQINDFLKPLGVGSFAAEVKPAKALDANLADLQHPLFERMFIKGGGKASFDGPAIFRYYPFTAGNGVEETVVLRMSNQAPALVESRPGGGLLYLFTFAPLRSWTDFSLKGSALGMMVQLSLFMNQAALQGESQALGNLKPVKLKTNEQDVVKMVSHEGTEIIPQWYAQSGSMVVEFDNPELKEGAYSLVQKGKELQKVAFNVPDAESEMEFANEEQLNAWLQAHQIQATITPPKEEAVNRHIEQVDKGTPLWKYFLIAALLFFIAEFLIIRFIDNPVPAHE